MPYMNTTCFTPGRPGVGTAQLLVDAGVTFWSQGSVPMTMASGYCRAMAMARAPARADIQHLGPVRQLHFASHPVHHLPGNAAGIVQIEILVGPCHCQVLYPYQKVAMENTKISTRRMDAGRIPSPNTPEYQAQEQGKHRPFHALMQDCFRQPVFIIRFHQNRLQEIQLFHSVTLL